MHSLLHCPVKENSDCDEQANHTLQIINNHYAKEQLRETPIRDFEENSDCIID